MIPNSLTLSSFDSIRNHVMDVLCQRDRIDPAQAELHQGRLFRGGKTCGVLFQLRGPRLLRTYAIWSVDEQRILFYESTGTRFAETKLIGGPNLCDVIDEPILDVQKAS